jgi:hypothetical protein
MRTYIKPDIKIRELSNESIMAASPSVTVNGTNIAVDNTNVPTPGGQTKRYNVWETDEQDAWDETYK